MLIQDRVSPHAVAAAAAGQNQKPSSSPRGAPGADRRHPRPFAKNLDFASWAFEHSSKLLILLFAVASAAAVFLLHGAAPDAAALLCLDRSARSSGPARLPYPDVAWSKVPPLAIAAGSPFASFRAERWIVVAVSSPPTAALAALARVKGWQLLAVGDSRTPAGWDLKGAIFLSLELQAQLGLGYRSVDFLPYGSHVRKTAGYLFAIQHGAKVIFDADDRTEVPGNDLARHFDVEVEEGLNCEKEKTYRVFFEKIPLTWQDSDLWCAWAIVQVPRWSL